MDLPNLARGFRFTLTAMLSETSNVNLIKLVPALQMPGSSPEWWSAIVQPGSLRPLEQPVGYISAYIYRCSCHAYALAAPVAAVGGATGRLVGVS